MSFLKLHFNTLLAPYGYYITLAMYYIQLH